MLLKKIISKINKLLIIVSFNEQKNIYLLTK